MATPPARPTGRSRTRSARNGIYLEVTSQQADVIREAAATSGQTIKDTLLGGLMRAHELEIRCAAQDAVLRDAQALLLGASTERALTKEEATLFAKVTSVLSAPK